MTSIRVFAPPDAEPLSRIIVRNLELVNIQDYPSQTIQALAKLYTRERLIKEASYCHMVVCLDGTEVLGTAAVDGDRVRNVFVDIRRHREGMGRCLMAAIETYALEHGQARLYLHAVPSARGFYEKLGYEVMGRIERELAGFQLVELLMAKELPRLDAVG